MKKVLLLSSVSMAVALYTGQVNADFNQCYMDTQYSAEWHLLVESPNNTIRGVVSEPGWGAEFGALTGTGGGTVNIAMGYNCDGVPCGLRYYRFSYPGLTGTTWGVYTGTYGAFGEYYDTPHSATIVPCGSVTNADASSMGTSND